MVNDFDCWLVKIVQRLSGSVVSNSFYIIYKFIVKRMVILKKQEIERLFFLGWCVVFGM